MGNSLDFGARIYDTRLGRWTRPDPLKGVYAGVSPYAFALNTPIRAIDPDGNLVIYVNGEVGEFKGGKSKHPDRASITYWTPGFVASVNGGFGESAANSRFVDGDLSMSASSRYSRAYTRAVADYNEIAKNLKRDENGKIIETIKMVSHSKGSSAANGYVAGLRAMVEANKDDYADPKNVIVSHLMLAPHQSWAIKVPKSNTATVAITHDGDPLSDDNVRGDVVTIETPGYGWGSWKTWLGFGHGVATFKKEATQMAGVLTENQAEGKDKYDGVDGALPNQQDCNAPDSNPNNVLPCK